MVAVGSLAVMLFATLLSYVLPQFREGLTDFIVQVPFLQRMISSMMGIDVSDGLTVQMILAVLWTHPVMLATIWAVEVVLCTRFPAGEVDRGTIEVLLGWPVSRRLVFWVETFVWWAAGACIVLFLIGGYSIGVSVLSAGERPAAGTVAQAAVNLLCLYGAVGGAAFLVSALSDRRGRAFAVMFGILIVSYLINFVAGIWDPARSIAFLSIMDYYKPADIFRTGGLAWSDPAVLLAIAAATWTAAMEIGARRSIATT